MTNIKLLFLGLVLISQACFGQDTIVTTERYLIGSTVLVGSNRNMESCIMHGYCLDQIIKHPCLDVMTETPGETKIKNIEQRNDTLIIALQYYENCALDFLGEIELLDNNTLNIVLHEYGSFASCMCTFDIDCFIIIAKEDIPEPVQIRYVTINDQKSTKIELYKN